MPKKKPEPVPTLDEISPRLRTTALAIAGQRRERITVVSRSRVLVDKPQNAKKPRTS